MRRLILFLSILFLAAPGFCADEKKEQPSAPADQTKPAAQTINRLALTAQQELQKSIWDLNSLRDSIASEKLPLAEELTGLEEDLAKLRKQYEDITRLVDGGALEVTTMKAEMKARQDELTYLANLLDEYARTFETRINISELQYCGIPLEAAKQANENTALSMPDKFKAQADFVDVSLKRLFDAVGGMKFSGVGVDTQGQVVDGTFAVIGPVTLFHAKSGNSAGIAIAQSGSTKPLIRPLKGSMQAGIINVVDKGEGFMPLDPTRGGALKAVVQKAGLIHIFKKGGPIMWPLLIAALLSLLTVIERVIFLLLEQRNRDPQAVESFFDAVSRGHLDEAISISKKSEFFVVRAMGYALTHRETSLSSALLYAQARELNRFRRGIPVLDTVITLAPLLGLLGTVTGMMSSFSLIGGELNSPGAITGGIAEALIATAFGLSTAIVSLIPFNVLNARAAQAEHELDSASAQLKLLMGSEEEETPGEKKEPLPCMDRQAARAA